MSCKSYLTERKELLDQETKNVAEMVRAWRVTGYRLVISPFTRSGPDQTEKWAYALLPGIHLTELLEDVTDGPSSRRHSRISTPGNRSPTAPGY